MDWKSDSRRTENKIQLKKLLEEFEGLGYLAESIEECCFQTSTSEGEYLKKLEKILLDRSDLDNSHHNCDICSFLMKATSKEWQLLNQIDI